MPKRQGTLARAAKGAKALRRAIRKESSAVKESPMVGKPVICDAVGNARERQPRGSGGRARNEPTDRQG